MSETAHAVSPTKLCSLPPSPEGRLPFPSLLGRHLVLPGQRLTAASPHDSGAPPPIVGPPPLASANLGPPPRGHESPVPCSGLPIARPLLPNLCPKVQTAEPPRLGAPAQPRNKRWKRFFSIYLKTGPINKYKSSN